MGGEKPNPFKWFSAEASIHPCNEIGIRHISIHPKEFTVSAGISAGAAKAAEVASAEASGIAVCIRKFCVGKKVIQRGLDNALDIFIV